MNIQSSGFGKEIEVKNYPRDGVPLMQSFYFRFSSSDRHIQAIVVDPSFPNEEKLTVAYYDDSRNDEFFYRISHHVVPDDRVSIESIVGVAKGAEVRELNKPANHEFVLVGVSFYYPGDDHHIDEVGVLENNGSLTVFFNDKNNDDLFRWEVHYAWVPQDLFIDTGDETGIKARGAVGRSIPSGIRVLRGFKLDYEPHFTSGNDHHLKEIGILTSGTTSGDLEVYYSDRNQDDGFDWEARWGILKPTTSGPGVILPGEFQARSIDADDAVRARFAESIPAQKN